MELETWLRDSIKNHLHVSADECKGEGLKEHLQALCERVD
jgi:hypothetical protein